MNTYMWRYKDWYVMVRNVGTKPVRQRASTWLCKMISDRKSNQIKKIQKLRDQISHVKAKCEYTVWSLDPQQSSFFTSSYLLCLAKSKFSLLVCGIRVEFLVVSVYPVSILIRPMAFWIFSREVSRSEPPKINGMLAISVTLWEQLIIKK